MTVCSNLFTVPTIPVLPQHPYLMPYHLLQWEVAKIKQLMTSNMTLTVLNLHQKIPKGATIEIQVKTYKRDIREINSIRYPRRDIK